jgi:hypothetical protein
MEEINDKQLLFMTIALRQKAERMTARRTFWEILFPKTITKNEPMKG